jgi:hypothetical protein
MLRPNTYRPRGRLRLRDRLRPRDNRPTNGTYCDGVATPVDPSVARARFAQFVARALDNARAGGMTDREIQRQSGVATSTFHRWRHAQGRGLPELPKVRAFCAATGASVEEAMRVLGMTDEAPIATPKPPLPREVRVILRKLADPTTPETEREFIRMTLQMLAERRTPPRSNGVEQAG